MTTLGERLRELRVHKDPYMKLRDAAEYARLHHVRLSHFEADREKPTTKELGTLAQVYDADVVELFDLWRRWQQAPPPDLTNAIICTGRTVDG